MSGKEEKERLLTPKGRKTVNVEGIGLLLNVFLFGIKLCAALWTYSDAILSDALHSLTDIASSFVVMAGLFLCALKRFSPLLRRRLESILTCFLCLFLLFTALKIGFNGLLALLQGKRMEDMPIWALAVTLFCVLCKEGMYRFVRKRAILYQSAALMTESWHHRSDALCSAGVFVGVFFSYLGFSFFDALSCIAVCVVICFAALDILLAFFRKEA